MSGLTFRPGRMTDEEWQSFLREIWLIERHKWARAARKMRAEAKKQVAKTNGAAK